MMRGGKSCENDYYSVMNQIMLRFRPIAPKPSGGEGDWVDRAAGVKKRSKRKYVRVGGRQKKSGRSEKCGGAVEEGSGVVTLQLLPPDRCRSEETQKSWSEIDGHSHNNSIKLDRGAVTKRWITVVVECITEIYTQSCSSDADGDGLGFGVSDGEKINNLEMDTCPGFVSDGSNNVVWVNEAYRKLVEGEASTSTSTWTWLVVKHKLPYLAPSFACRLRMIQQTSHGHKWNTILPCDVSRMDFPGFAWKLDVNTALRLAI